MSGGIRTIAKTDGHFRLFCYNEKMKIRTGENLIAVCPKKRAKAKLICRQTGQRSEHRERRYHIDSKNRWAHEILVCFAIMKKMKIRTGENPIACLSKEAS